MLGGMSPEPSDGEAGATKPSLDVLTVDAAVARERVRAELFGGDVSTTRLGRFDLLERIGQGGMGVVFAGYDPELDRKVAIKVIRPARDGSRDRVRLLREARALAQLSEPNVVGIYEVGEHDDRVWIAMEFVDGSTLTKWIARDPAPTWRQTLAAFVQAARGLQAAHARGIVHRDFKPDNVLVSSAGVVKVVDFGLARAISSTPSQDEHPIAGDVDDELEPGVTSSGAMAGTPAYMAPEQFEGGIIDARADQFSFCVALWEALYGQPPFARESFAALVLAVQAGRIQSPPASDIPARIERTLRRGMMPRADDRFVDMAALVHALERDPMRRVLRIGAVGLAVAATGAIAYGLGRGEQPRPCAEPPSLPGWDEDARARLRAHVEDPGVGAPADAWPVLERALDGYRDAWVAERSDACAATHVRGEQSESQLDLRRACSDLRARELAAVLARLEHADAAALEKSVMAVTTLPAPSGCADAELLGRRAPPPTDPDALATYHATEESVAEAKAAALLGDDAASRTGAEAALAAAQSIGRGDLEAEARYQLGKIQIDRSELQDGMKSLEAAYWAARSSGHDAYAAMAAADLATQYALTDPETAATWTKHAQVEVDRLGDEGALRGRLLTALGNAAMHARDLERAAELHRQSLAIFESLEGEDGLDVAVCAHNLGIVEFLEGKDDDARAHFERALAIWREGLGPEHPQLAEGYAMLGNLAHRGGRLEEAEASYQRGMELLERAYGRDHIRVAEPLNGLALVAQDRGQLDRAIVLFERAIELLVKNNGKDDAGVAMFEANLAEVLSNQGRHEDALAHYRRGLEISLKVLGPDHRGTSDGWSAIGQELLALGRAAEAVEPLEKALALRVKLDAPPRYRWRPRLALARALAASGGDRRRARELATTARDEVLTLEDPKRRDEGLAEVDAALAELDR